MHPRPLLPVALLAVATAALAGCLGQASPEAVQSADEPLDRPAGDGSSDQPTVTPAPDEGVAPVPAATIAAYPFVGHITLSVGAQGVGYLNPSNPMDTHWYRITVEPGAQALVAELRWADPLVDFDLELLPPGCDPVTGHGGCIFIDGGAPGAGDTPLRFVLEDPAVLANGGEWYIAVWAKNAVNASFEGAVSVFHGGLPAEDYTALP